MNKLSCAILAFFLITSCSKNDPVVCIDDVCVDGEWEWVQSYGSIAGLTITPDTEQMTKTLIIDETNYQEFVDGNSVVETAYEYVKTDELKTFTTDSLVLKLATGNWYAVFEENDNLILFEPCFDCWAHTYKRK